MAKSYGRKPTTVPGKKLSIKHLKETQKLEKRKAKEHRQQAAKGIDVAYNKAHAKKHEKDVKERSKYLKKAAKLKVKALKKVSAGPRSASPKKAGA